MLSFRGEVPTTKRFRIRGDFELSGFDTVRVRFSSSPGRDFTFGCDANRISWRGTNCISQRGTEPCSVTIDVSPNVRHRLKITSGTKVDFVGVKSPKLDVEVLHVTSVHLDLSVFGNYSQRNGDLTISKTTIRDVKFLSVTSHSDISITGSLIGLLAANLLGGKVVYIGATSWKSPEIVEGGRIQGFHHHFATNIESPSSTPIRAVIRTLNARVFITDTEGGAYDVKTYDGDVILETLKNPSLGFYGVRTQSGNLYGLGGHETAIFFEKTTGSNHYGKMSAPGVTIQKEEEEKKKEEESVKKEEEGKEKKEEEAPKRAKMGDEQKES